MQPQETIRLKDKRQKVRNYLTVVDDSFTSIVVTLWGEMSTKNQGIIAGDIIAVKGGRISDFGGKTLNAADDHATLIMNPESE